MIHEELSRRSVLRVIGAGGACLILGCAPTESNAVTEGNAAVDWEANAFVKIDDKGVVTIMNPKSEMGQGTRTTLAMIVAEELDADWTKVQVQQPPGNSAKYGGQGTGGSSSVRGTYGRLRQAGAAARAMLMAAAAARWGVPAMALKTENGAVINPQDGKSLTYGELVAEASKLSVPADLQLKPRSQFRLIGKRTKRVDAKELVTGNAVFAQDIKVQGAAVAVVARRPAYGASLKSVDDAEARKVTGVIDVIKSGNSVIVLGENSWAAIKGRDALKLDWDSGPNAKLTSEAILAGMKGALKPFPSLSGTVVEATYEFPYLSHAPMEPMNAVADVKDASCVVWVPSQGADSAQGAAARASGLGAEQVTATTTLCGGGFGRRLSQDYVSEAVSISKLAKRPIKLLWTREDDIKNDNYRPMALHAFAGSVDASGNPTAWHQQILEAGGGQTGVGEFGGGRLPYDIPEVRVAQGRGASPVPTGAWRSVENTHTIPAMECFLDELATAAKRDPMEFRLSLMRNGRLKRCLEIVKQKSGWGKSLPKGEGMGIACFGGYGSCCAHVIHVRVTGSEIKVLKVYAAVDCGLAINPLGVEAQIEGGCCDALATGLHAAITIKDGGVEQENWYDFEWLRYPEAPEFDITVEVTDNDPGGMGEVGYPGVMPALANAVFAATGKRVRKWPLKLEELV